MFREKEKRPDWAPINKSPEQLRAEATIKGLWSGEKPWYEVYKEKLARESDAASEAVGEGGGEGENVAHRRIDAVKHDFLTRPTEEKREVVRALVSFGVSYKDIAKYIGISVGELAVHYREELDTGATHANMQVARCLYELAISGRNIKATMFWLKARAGWRDVIGHEVTGKDGGPLQLTWAGAIEQLQKGVTYEAEPDEGDTEEQ